MSTPAPTELSKPFALTFNPSAHGRTLIGVGAFLAVTFTSAVALPLATYTTALAVFGLAHVGSELRYVDYRFGSRLRGSFGLWLGLPLAMAFVARLAGMMDWISDSV